MTGSWNDFNDAEAQRSFDVIPKGAVAPVRMTIKPGGYDDPGQGWTGSYATRNETTGSIYLNAEFVITEGPHARRRVWSLIGLVGPKGPEWGNMGRSFVRGILNSARGLSEKDASPQANAARRIEGLHVLDGIEFLARIDIGKDQNGEPRNEIRAAVTLDHRDWQAFQQAGGQWRPAMLAAGFAPQPPQQAPVAAPVATPAPQGQTPQQPVPQPGAPASAGQPALGPAAAPAAQPANPNRPAWAQ